MDATVALIEERGVEGFSLREVARRAGVSPTAPAYHFRDARGLLTAVATEGFLALGDGLAAAEANAGDDRRAKLLALAHAYLEFALANRGRYMLMWRKGLLDMADAEHVAAGQRAFSMLDRSVRGNAAKRVRPDDPALAPSLACWSMVHGFALLALDGAFESQGGDPVAPARTLLPLVLEHLRV
ncbi:MAG TPA: TetR/AcrR family transcriptional regulator [Sphingomonadaceae bacterium]|nr:TetR/AcrR family transcriptional regulator [Sphingomonadaceae bacterium]